MPGGAFEFNGQPGLAVDGGDDADRQACYLQDRTLLDMVFDIGQDVLRPPRCLAEAVGVEAKVPDRLRHGLAGGVDAVE